MQRKADKLGRSHNKVAELAEVAGARTTTTLAVASAWAPGHTTKALKG